MFVICRPVMVTDVPTGRRPLTRVDPGDDGGVGVGVVVSRRRAPRSRTAWSPGRRPCRRCPVGRPRSAGWLS